VKNKIKSSNFLKRSIKTMLEKPRTMALYPKGSATGFTPSLPGDGRERFQEKPGKVGSGWIEVFKEQ